MEKTTGNQLARDMGTTRRNIIAGGAAVAAVGLITARVHAEEDDGISRSAEAIHQEPVFKATAKQVYEALTEAKQFDQVQRMSEAMRSMAVAAKPAEIGMGAGAAFSLFGGYVTGRHIELAPNKRIVQAWRAGSWKDGDYSIVRFELVEQGSGTKIVFDHLGFPQGQAAHLAAGWKSNYWEPLEKFFAKS